MGLRPGQRISVHDLLRGLIMLSAGDAAHTLAIEAAGTVKKFVGQMNRYAAALGLTNTHYENPIGLNSPTQLLERPRPRDADRGTAEDPGLRQDRRLARSDPAQHAAGRAHPLDQRVARNGPLGDRGEDRPHLEGGLRHGRLRQPERGAADRRGHRRADRRNALLRRLRTARMGLPPVPPAKGDPQGRRIRQPRDQVLRRRTAAGRRPLADGPPAGRPEGRSHGRRPRQGHRPDPPRRAASAPPRSASTASAREPSRWSPAATSRPRAPSTRPEVSSANIRLPSR